VPNNLFISDSARATGNRSESAEGAPYTSLGRRPRSVTHRCQRAVGPTYRAFSRLPILAPALCSPFLFGGSKPDTIEMISTPTVGLSFTQEISKGLGPATGDFTRVFIHLERNGRSRKGLFLSGDYVVLNKVIWTNPNDAILCIDRSGLTDQFKNNVTLILTDTTNSKSISSLERIANHEITQQRRQFQ
jgi:hypothetical protein